MQWMPGINISTHFARPCSCWSINRTLLIRSMSLQSPGGNSGNPAESLPRIPSIAFGLSLSFCRIWIFVFFRPADFPACLTSYGWERPENRVTPHAVYTAQPEAFAGKASGGIPPHVWNGIPEGVFMPSKPVVVRPEVGIPDGEWHGIPERSLWSRQCLSW